MTLALTLLPITVHLGPGLASHEVLAVTLTEALAGAVLGVRSRPLAETLNSYMGSAWGRQVHEVEGPSLVISTEPAAVVDQVRCYGLTTEDAFGQPLRWVFADALAELRLLEDVSTVAHNRAVWAYLGALPPDARVVLYWH